MKPDIKKYLDVFQYLRDFYSFRKHLNAAFSYQVWSKELGIKNKSYLRFIALGRRPISEKMRQGLVQNLELQGPDAEYFEILCHYSQSKTPSQKAVFGRRLIQFLKAEGDMKEIEPHFEFLSNPVLPKLLTLLSFSDIEKSPANFARLLMTGERDIEKSLELLKNLGLAKDTENGLQSVSPSFRVPPQFHHLGLSNYYCQSLADAREAIHLPAEERRYRSLLVAMDPEEFQAYAESLNDFAREMLAKHDRDRLGNRRLYQLNFNAFPVSQSPVSEPSETS